MAAAASLVPSAASASAGASASASASSSSPSSSPASSLLAWLIHNGASTCVKAAGIHSDPSSDFDDGASSAAPLLCVSASSHLVLAAKSHGLEKDTVVATVPRQLILTAQATYAAHLIASACASTASAELTSWVTQLAMAVAAERAIGDKSFWKPYLDTVPRRADVPYFWTHRQRRRLQGTEAEAITLSAEARAKHEWNACVASAFKQDERLSKVTYEDYLDARSTVTSRAFDIGGEERAGMVPLFDLFNHVSADENVNVGTDRDGAMQLICVRAAAPHEQIFNTYGRLGNAHLLAHYGFVDARNPVADSARLPSSLVRAAAAAQGVAGAKIAQVMRDVDCPDHFAVAADGTPDHMLLEAISRMHDTVAPPRAELLAPLPARTLASALSKRIAEFGDDVEADDGGSGDENDKSRVGAASCVRDAELGALRACHSNAEQLAANLPEKTPANNSAANAPWDLF